MRTGFFAIIAAAIWAAAAAGPVQAGPHIVVDLGNGKVLSQEGAFQPWYPASLTKLMTAWVAFRAIEDGQMTLQSPVTISANAAKEPPSKMGYKPGSVLTLDNALKIIMVKSANDVATAIGESVAGSEEAFARRMNLESQRLGMTGSHWVNAHGLHADQQFTTARDLAVLAASLRTRFPQYAGYFKIEAIGAGKTIIPNHNTLIARFAGADGMKTGYTCPSGFNMVASASRDGRTLIAVVIGESSTETRAEKAAELLVRGFRTGGFAAPRLAGLRPSGRTTAQPVNLRSTICTTEAREARWNNRGEGGKVVIRSPHIFELDRPRRVVAVGLGGVTGPVAPMPEYANVPIPTPRPDYRPTLAQGG